MNHAHERKRHVIVSTLIDIKTTLPTNNDDSKYARRVVNVRSKLALEGLQGNCTRSKKERASKEENVDGSGTIGSTSISSTAISIRL
jgi:hypothetical protein